MIRLSLIVFLLLIRIHAVSQVNYKLIWSKKNCEHSFVKCDSVHNNATMYGELNLDMSEKKCELYFYYLISGISHLSYLNTYYKGRIEPFDKEYEIILDSLWYNEWYNYGYSDGAERTLFTPCEPISLVLKIKGNNEDILFIKQDNSIFKFKRTK